MNITREAIQKRLDQLLAEHEQAKANAFAYEGAIQECQYWLNELDTADTEADKQEK